MIKHLHFLRRQSNKILTEIYFTNSNETPHKEHTFDQNIKNMSKAKPKGVLSIIPTPIGNLRDVTPNMLKKLY